jgi:hypothetical protein
MYQVNIEFLRVQTFLFAVPRLRNMVGANVLIGEMIRRDLPQLAEKYGNQIKLEIPKNLQFTASCDDPLNKSSFIDEKDKDDPIALYKRGILRRDGGHFSALFEEEKQAEAFQQAARNKLRRELLGLRFEMSCHEFGTQSETQQISAVNQQLIELPQLQVCQVSGNGPAVETEKQDDDSEKIYISASAHQAKKKGNRFFAALRGNKEEQTHDMVGLLSHTLPLGGKKEPTDFQDLCGNDYMAVIHADGNSIGQRYKAYRNTTIPKNISKLEQEMYGEEFFYSMRVVVRCALKEALYAVFKEPQFEYSPYQILMLGGDDLLMICRAKQAFDFIIEYDKALQNKKLADKQPLTIGAGIVIASPNLPFYHLHHLAESLASSAKQLFRSQPEDQQTSVVDWIVSTQAWVDDPIALRRKQSLVHYEVDGQPETLRLNNRPYQILGDDLNALECLWNRAQELEAKISGQKAARSQLRQLVVELEQGRHWANLAALGLPLKTQQALENVKVLKRLENDVSLWNNKEGNDYYTALADLIELYEIHNLKREEQQRKKVKK